jgi:hypothetical protein
MALKSRFLQISDIMMFEYVMHEGPNNADESNPTSFIYTKLKDNHTLLLSPISYECVKIIDEESNDKYKIMKNPLSINTLNHTVVPSDAQDSMFFYFLDPDYKYIDERIMNDIYYNQIKARMYGKHMLNPFNNNSAPLENYYSNITDVRWDSARLYFVNGYDFSNIYGIYMRISVSGNDIKDSTGKVIETDRIIDLCDIFINKSTFYKLCKFSINPTMFGNNIYDRYIEVNVACVWDLIQNRYNHNHYDTELFEALNINDDTQIKLSFAYITEDDMSIRILDRNEYTDADKAEFPDIDTDNIVLDFTRSSVLNGIIPRVDLNSDNLGAYISECHDMPYLIFYATWRDKPLTANTVWSFNKGIRLYDRSLIRDDYEEEVGDDYEPEYDMKKWLVIHEIKCSFCMADHVVKEETYSMTQIFVNDTDPNKFYYRPIIFDEAVGMYIDNVQIVYTMRLVNSHDKIQFVKVSTLSLYGNMSRYYVKGTSLKIADLTPYKIYNKIIENKHENIQNQNGVQKTKYIKVFYNSTEVVLDDQGNYVNGEYNYILNVSQAPKSYKFVFKTLGNNGTYSYMDMSNGYYKLLFRDEGGNNNLIDPTFSTNMNLYVGELEFNFNASMINKMLAVSEEERKMSIVAYNEDGTVSSMFDFMYSI